MQEAKNVYHKEFDAALHEYSAKQTRPQRRIGDYFEHVSETEQDMAVEVIIQCGDKKFWEQNSGDKIFMKQVYKQLLLKLQEYLPDFKIANAVVHFDEASPHMHVVGVPAGTAAQREDITVQARTCTLYVFRQGQRLVSKSVKAIRIHAPSPVGSFAG